MDFNRYTYLGNYVNKFRTKLPYMELDVPTLHRIMDYLGVKQISPSVYNRGDLDYILMSNKLLTKIRKFLGIYKEGDPEDFIQEPKEPRVPNYYSSKEMADASDELLRNDGVFNEGKIRITESDIKKMVRCTVSNILREQEENDLIDLFNYLSRPADKNIYDANGRLDDISQAAYNYFTPKQIVHNVWAVHYTHLEAWEDIMQNGFKGNITNYDELAYSGRYHELMQGNTEEGWLFALPIDNEYMGGDCGYGDMGYIILTDGVRAFHEGDGDDEIIFKNKYVKKKIPFAFEDDYCAWNLVGNSDFDFVWDINNLPQGSYYEEEINKPLFYDVKDLIAFVISQQ